MNRPIYFIIDFDSTFTKVEALDELCKISLADDPDKEKVYEQIQEITNLAMAGKIAFSESLSRRVSLLKGHRDHLPALVEVLKDQVSESITRNLEFFEKFADQVYIISNGFKEVIDPIVADYHIKPENVYANRFHFDKDGYIIGVDEKNLLAQDQGKVKVLQEFDADLSDGEVYVIGDGYNDYQIREAGLAHRFYAFTENVSREDVIEKADHVAATFDEFLYENKLPRKLSFPKSKIKVLLLENVHPDAERLFKKEGYSIEKISGGLDEDELCEKIKGVSIIGIRSKTQITKRVLEHADRLMVVGAFCIGTNQINLEECARRGVAVFNAPYSNTRSVVELAIGEIVMLMRRLPDKIAGMHQGKWQKSAKNAREIRGKKLGIVGYGNIGAQLSVVAESMGMKVYYYDLVDRLPMGNALRCNSLHELLRQADVVTLHVDGRPENKKMFTAEDFKAMKEGAILLNLARGAVVDIPALKEALESGKLAGAGIDVYPEEPKSNKEEFVSELRGLDNLIMTPHIGGSTEEAQENIGNYVPEKVIQYINTGSTFASVNFPQIQLPVLKDAHRLIHTHLNKAGVLAQINQVLSKYHINITGQYLKTNEEIGYVITDVDKEYDDELIKELRAIEGTIRMRVLF